MTASALPLTALAHSLPKDYQKEPDLHVTNPESVPYSDLIKEMLPNWEAIPGQEAHPGKEPDYPGAEAGADGEGSGVMYGGTIQTNNLVPAFVDPDFTPNLNYEAKGITESDDDDPPGNNGTASGDDLSYLYPYKPSTDLKEPSKEYPKENKAPCMFFSTGLSDVYEISTVTKEAKDTYNDNSTTINNDYDYDYNYDYNYYFFDVGLQFTPRVGSVFSINTNPFITYLGSAAKSSDASFATGKGTLWQPDKEDLPDVLGALGLSYRYAALYDGYWGIRQYTFNEDSHFWTDALPGIPSTELRSQYDSANTTFERSWQNRHPGQIINEKDEKEDYYANAGNGSIPEVDNPVSTPPSWFNTNQLKGTKDSDVMSYEDTKKNRVKDIASKNSFVSLQPDRVNTLVSEHVFYEWYKDSQVAKQDKDTFNTSNLAIPEDVRKRLSDDVLRALDILGEDILLRDEWVASDAYSTNITYKEYGGNKAFTNKVDFYYYLYSNTSVLDNTIFRAEEPNALTVGNTDLITKDYVIQSIYRALGINCLKSSVYLYADKHYTINNTPLATQLTVALDKVNQIQNRMDVFVSRTDLNKYWEQAVKDGIVENSGESVVNYIDGKYRPMNEAITASDRIESKQTIPQDINCKVKGEKIDSSRVEHITLAEFCVLLKRLMHIYGEEVLTDQEQEMLLVYYGTKLPYYLPDEEQLEAIKYLMAKGIVSDIMLWDAPLRIEDMLVILSRVKDKDSRLTFKEIQLEYDKDLLKEGYYPAQINTGIDKATVDVIGTIRDNGITLNGDTWIDYYIQLKGQYMFTQNGKPVPVSKVYIANGKDYAASTLKPVDGFEFIGYDQRSDGHNYAHFRVKMKLMFKTDKDNNVLSNQLNTNYVQYNEKLGHYIEINSSSDSDSPRYYRVSIGGGIYRSYEVTDDGGKPVYSYASRYYTKDKNSVNTTYMEAEIIDLSSNHVDPNDYNTLRAYGCYPSTIQTLISEGGATYVGKAAKLTYKSDRPKLEGNNSFSTFNDKNFGIDLLDFDRAFAGYAIQLSDNPYLSGENSALDLVPCYSIFFKVPVSEDSLSGEAHSDILAGDIYWGDIKVVAKEKPAEVLPAGVELGLFLHAKADGFYTYCLKGAHKVSEVSNNLKLDGASTKFTAAYTKQNNTFLIDTDTLKEVMQQYNKSQHIEINHVSVSEYADGIILISYEAAPNGDSGRQDSIVNNIFLMDELKLVIVNNYIYKVPDNEKLYVKKQGDKGGYLVNFRVALGWPSGFTYDKSTGDMDGNIYLNLASYSTGNYEIKPLPITNIFTQQAEYIIGMQRYAGEVFGNGHASIDAWITCVPLTAAYPLANYFVYQGTGGDAYLFVIKNKTDNMAVPKPEGNSNLQAMTNGERAQSIYTEGPKWLNSLLGVKFDESKYLVAVYGMNETENTGFVIPTEKVLNCPRNSLSELYGKIYFDPDLHAYAYIIPSQKSKESMLGSARCKDPQEYKDYSSSAQQVAYAEISAYYSCERPLPFFKTSDKSQNQFYNYTSNIYEINGTDYYGVTPACTNVELMPDTGGSTIKAQYSTDGSTWTTISDTDMVTAFGYFVDKSGTTDGRCPEPKVAAPVGLIATILGLPEFKKEDFGNIGEDNSLIGMEASLKFEYIYDGNIKYVLTKSYSDYDDDGNLKQAGNKVYAYLPNRREMKFLVPNNLGHLIAISTGKIMTSRSAVSYTLTDQRQHLVDDTTRGSLEDLSQPTGVDWGEFTFERLIHNIDNGFSIILIIVLNVIPRIAMFVFIILIGLSTITTIKPWRKFCTNVFDPYKLITFGHSDVATINTKLLMISSIVGLAVFALFMDGTLIHVLTWIVQFFSGFIAR